MGYRDFKEDKKGVEEVERERIEVENKGENSNRQNAFILIEGEKEVCNIS
jgi:hypothetical protein